MSWPTEKSFNRYPSDLTDAEWEIIQPILAAQSVLEGGFCIAPTIRKIWADYAYRGHRLVEWLQQQFNCTIEVAEKNKSGECFQVLPRRWVAERTLA